MSKYRKVRPSLFGTREFRSLTPLAPSGAALYLRLLTGPEMTAVPGFVIAGPAMIAEAMSWPAKATSAAFDELERAGIAQTDRAARLVFFPGELVDAPENPNVALHWARVLEEAPDSDLRDDVVRAVWKLLETKDERFRKPFSERFEERLLKPFADGSRNPEPEPEPEPEHEPKEEAASPSLARVSPIASRRKPETPCPPTGTDEAELAAWADGWKIDRANPEFLSFVTWHRSGDKRRRDWTAAWQNWLTKNFASGARSPRATSGQRTGIATEIQEFG